MNTLTLIGKPHILPLELFDPYLEIEFEVNTADLENEISFHIELLNNPVLVAYYDIEVMVGNVRDNEDNFRVNQSFVD